MIVEIDNKKIDIGEFPFPVIFEGAETLSDVIGRIKYAIPPEKKVDYATYKREKCVWIGGHGGNAAFYSSTKTKLIVYTGAYSYVGPFNKLEDVIICANSRINSYCSIKNSIILEDSEIGDYCLIENSIVYGNVKPRSNIENLLYENLSEKN